MKKKGQNLVEFVFIMPVLVFVIFAVIELSFYWKNVHAVQNVAVQAGARAVTAIVTEYQTGTDIGNLCNDSNYSDASAGCLNYAASLAFNTLLERYGSFVYRDLTFTLAAIESAKYGAPPYTRYKFDSNEQLNGRPILTLYVDYSDPYKEGLVTQVVLQHHPLFLNFGVGSPDGESFMLMQDIYEISSTKVKQHSHY